MHFLFALDELTDRQSASEANITLSLVAASLAEPSEPLRSDLFKAMANVLARFKSLSSGSNAQERFVLHTQSYLEAVLTQASLREQKKRFDSLDAYKLERRQNSATLLLFDFVELQLGIDLPPTVYDCQEFLKIYLAAVDLVCITNDVYSFRMEKAIGHTETYNYVTTYMSMYRFGLVEAIEFADTEVRKLWAELTTDPKNLPSFGEEVDKDVADFFSGVILWIEGFIHWTFKSNRYFGDMNKAILDTHTIQL